MSHKNLNTQSVIKLFFFLSLLLSIGCGDKTDSPKKEMASSNKEESLSSKGSLSTRTEIYSPEKELAGFKVPEGFVVELVASEKDGVINPIDLTFDDAGRLWTQTAKMYPLDPIVDQYINREGPLAMENDQAQNEQPNFKRIRDLYQGKTKGDDKILVLSNFYGDKNIKVNTWAEGLAIPQSILPYKNGSYVAQGSEMFFLEDTDKDGKADKRTPLFTGFGFTDTHTMSHTLVRGPGEWIHFSHGALNKGEVTSLTSDAKVMMNYSKVARFSFGGEKIELVNSGLNNIWGFQLRANGEWYGCEANDLGYSVVPMEVGTGYPGIGGDRLRPYQPWMDKVHEFRIGGTGISGLAFAEDSSGSFPEEWKDVALLANPITSTINAVKIVRNPDGSVSAEHLPDLLTSEDDWFRPVNMEFGPDGALYIVDWYNKIVSHNEVATSDPSRDKSHGRIWRIRHKTQKEKEIPNFYEINTKDLVKYIEAPSLWAKRAAWHQISDRPIEETKILAKDLISILSDISQDEITRIMALWSLEGIHHYDRKLMNTLVSAKSDNLRREAVRSLTSFSLDANELAGLLEIPVDDSNPMVRSQVLRTLGEARSANSETIALLVRACKPPLEGNAMGGPYERNFERYLARKSLENYQDELWAFIQSGNVPSNEATNIIWASQALPKAQREKVFLDFWKNADYKSFDEPTFIAVAGMLENKEIYTLVRPILEQSSNAEQHVIIALNNVGQVQSKELAQVMTKPVGYLLKSKEKEIQHLGLNAVGKLGISSLDKAVISMLEENPTTETALLVMNALKDRPVENSSVFVQLAKKEALNLATRASALQIYAKADIKKAYTVFDNWLPKLTETDQKSITKIVSGTVEGSMLLKQLFEKGIITSKAFDISSAEKIQSTDQDDTVGQKILEEVKLQIEEDKKAYAAKLEKFMAIAETGGGNATNGEQLFQMCLLCHKVGKKGQEYAPALDGSASRENEALLTAILNPNAAMESSYAVYRVTKNDDSTVEGYLVQRDDKGTMMGFMGGSQQFIPANEISAQEFLVGRSFMPEGLIDNYSDDQVADLLAYVGSLK